MALLKNVSESDRLRYEQESRDKFLFDLHWDKVYKFEEGMQKGLQKGRQEGIEEGMQKVVLSMLNKNLNLSFISEITGLSKEEIKRIKKK